MPDFLTNLFDSSELHAAPVLRELDRRSSSSAPHRVRRPDLARLSDDPGRVIVSSPGGAATCPSPGCSGCSPPSSSPAASPTSWRRRFYWPAYRLMGVVKLITAAVSWATVIGLVRWSPALALGSGGTPDGDRRRSGWRSCAAGAARGHSRFDPGPGHGRQDHLLEPRAEVLYGWTGGGPGESPTPAQTRFPSRWRRSRPTHPRGGWEGSWSIPGDGGGS